MAHSRNLWDFIQMKTRSVDSNDQPGLEVNIDEDEKEFQEKGENEGYYFDLHLTPPSQEEDKEEAS